MILGRFGEVGELFFEIDLISAQGEFLAVEALLDTGFTRGWLALNDQDVETLGWTVIEVQKAMQTPRGEEWFDIYAGTVSIDGQEFTIPVVAGEGIAEILLGLQWLQTRRLTVDFSKGVLILQDSE